MHLREIFVEVEPGEAIIKVKASPAAVLERTTASNVDTMYKVCTNSYTKKKE